MIIDTDEIYLDGQCDGMKLVCFFIESGVTYSEWSKNHYGQIDNKHKYLWKKILKSLGRENEFQSN